MATDRNYSKKTPSKKLADGGSTDSVSPYSLKGLYRSASGALDDAASGAADAAEATIKKFGRRPSAPAPAPAADTSSSTAPGGDTSLGGAMNAVKAHKKMLDDL